MLLAFGEATSEIQAQILLASAIIASGISTGFWIRERKKLMIARLIIENPIMHIRTAIISDISGEAAQREDIENTEVVVSYFGILMDAKIIKFNQDGILLRAVEIEDDFISFTYGTDKRLQNTRLLRPKIERLEMDEIFEKFRYETGITPAWLS